MMTISKLLIANRGEIAIRISRAAAELGISTVAVYSRDDADSLHVHMADESHEIPGTGVPAYLDGEGVVAAALEMGADAVHPGYGFMSESAPFASLCTSSGLTFVGPAVNVLQLLGDKVRARAAAKAANVPVLPGTDGDTSLEEAMAFFDSLSGAPMIIKAVMGGGGRGVRVVRSGDELAAAYARSEAEAKAAFGDGSLYVEKMVENARHIEVQILGDGSGAVAHLGERDCSLQRRHQKLVEIAPAPGISEALRSALCDAAVRLAESIRYSSVGTVEFLVETGNAASGFHFIEANARLQVEHTVTEEVMGVDIVRAQLELANGRSLSELGLPAQPEARGFAVQVRVNMETMTPEGEPMPSGGVLASFDPPTGPGLRTDTFGYSGYQTNPRFDSLLAKAIAHSPSPRYEDAIAKAHRALCEFRIEGVPTNLGFLQALLEDESVIAGDLSTRLVDDHMAALAVAAHEERRQHYVGGHAPVAQTERADGRAGVRVDPSDPLAVLSYGQAAAAELRASVTEDTPPVTTTGPAGTIVVQSPLQGTIVELQVESGDEVVVGQVLLVMESMKMQHEIKTEVSGTIRRIAVQVGETLYQGHPLLYVEEGDVDTRYVVEAEEQDLDYIRPDLAATVERHNLTLDEFRPKAVARRRHTSQRTTRENIDHLLDDGSFLEYGPLVIAAQAARRTKEELIEKSPADGMIIGVGTVNGDLFPEPESRVAVIAYDYTVFAGTQGNRNHMKTDRMLEVAKRGRMPVVLFAEGGGGRPGDTEVSGSSHTFAVFPSLSGLVPMVAITSGRCFAGNASVAGFCDVIIATENSNIGMGGPAMVEGGGLGVFTPEEIGPMSVQVPNGVVDIAVKDEEEAVEVAKKYLSYFQGRAPKWEVPDQRQLRYIVPENRLRVYDVREVIETLADVDSVLELRPHFGVGMITAFIRVEGRPIGVIANNPNHLGGAIDADGSDKSARFMQICDAFDIPILFLMDTPGIMVGPEVEHTALVRHASRPFLIGANVDVPVFSIILRKSYGLGMLAMSAGGHDEPYFHVAWPSGEFGGMGLEGQVKLGYRDELAAIQDPEERLKKYEEMVAQAYEDGKALNYADRFSIDDVIDPADSRDWISGLLRSIRPPAPREGKKRPWIDAW